MEGEALIPQTPPAPPSAITVTDGAKVALDAARAKAVARFKAVPAPGALIDPNAATPPIVAKVDMDPATLKRLTRQSADLRAAEQKITELQSAATDSATVLQAKRLYGEGKRLEAIALLSGRDATEEMAALMDAYLDTTPTTPEQLQAARIEALEADKKTREEAAEADRKTAETERIKQRDAAIQGFAWSVLDAAKEAAGGLTFPLCASKKNRGEAAVAALRLVSQVYAPKEHPTGDVTPDQARALYLKAFADVETEYEKQYAEELGERFVPKGSHNPLPGRGHVAPAAPRPATTEPTPAEPSRANTSPTISRPAITTTQWPRSLTHAQAREKAIEKVRSFQR